MKRFHVHLHVDDLGRSIDFYSKLFAAAAGAATSEPAACCAPAPRGKPVGIAVRSASGCC